MADKFPKREQAILIGLYLSKFDEKGLSQLGFDGFQQAFNVLGYAAGAEPSSIKNYRDEFDPFFPNPRKGWRNRPIRDYCKIVMERFAALDFSAFSELVKSFLLEEYEIETITSKPDKDRTEAVAKRLITGRAAEEYFKGNYRSIDVFANCELKDTRNLACGFDYRLSHQTDYYGVEVKGLNAASGSIMLTEKEFYVAERLRARYCLFIVSNFVDSPRHQYFFDPLHSRLSFENIQRRVIQTSFKTAI